MFPLRTHITVFVFCLSLLATVLWGSNAYAYTPEIDSLIVQAEGAKGEERVKLFARVCWKLRNSDPEAAVRFGLRAAEAAGDEHLEALAQAQSFLGVAYRNVGNYSQAMHFYQESLALSKKLDYREQMAYGYINIGNIYLYQDLPDEALPYLEKALQLADELQNNNILGYALLNLGRTRLRQGHYTEALPFLERSLNVRKELDDPEKIAVVHHYIGKTHKAAGKLFLARKHQNLALRMSRSTNSDLDLICSILTELANLYLEEGRPDSAEMLGKESLMIAQEIGVLTREKDAARVLSLAYSQLGDFSMGYQYLVRYAESKDSLFTSETSRQLATLKAGFEKEKQQIEYEALESENALQRKLSIITIASTFILLLLSVFLVRNMWAKGKANKILSDQNVEIERIAEELMRQHEDLNQTLRELESSQHRLQETQHIAKLGTWEYTLNKQNSMVSWSSETFTITGFREEEGAPTIEEFLEVVHPDDRESLRVGISRITSERIGYELELRIFPKENENTMRYVHTRSVPVENEKGKVTHVRGTMLDITERKELEVEILEAKERTERIYDLTSRISGDLEESIRRVLYYGLEVFKMEEAFIMQTVEGSNDLLFTLHFVKDSNKPGALQGQQTAREGLLCKHILRKQQPLLLSSVAKSKLTQENKDMRSIGAYVGVPLWIEGKLYGTVAFTKKQAHTIKYDEADEDFLLRLAQWLAGAIGRKRFEEILQTKNRNITASISYAQRIQRAMLPSLSEMRQHIPELFVFFRPRDIVSGDFYWFAQRQGNLYLAAVDCTGHGVPGAFMSLIGNDLFGHAVQHDRLSDPGGILRYVHKGIIRALRQESTHNQDGMEAALCVLNPKQEKMAFAGANRPLYRVTKNGELQTLKGGRQGLGGVVLKEEQAQYPTHFLHVEPETNFYISSDGYQDQFGGEEGKKFMKKRFRQTLLEAHNLPPDAQERHLAETLDRWQGEERQVDDILVLGFKFPRVASKP